MDFCRNELQLNQMIQFVISQEKLGGNIFISGDLVISSNAKLGK